MVEITTIGTAKEGSQTIDIRPTLLIGLGGTGKEVLRRLRRMFYEKYRVVGLPVMEYLWFDTDIRNESLSGEVHLTSWTGSLTLPFHRRLMGGSSPRSWLDTGATRMPIRIYGTGCPANWTRCPTNAIMQGAGQIRSFGRLAFFHHYARKFATPSKG